MGILNEAKPAKHRSDVISHRLDPIITKITKIWPIIGQIFLVYETNLVTFVVLKKNMLNFARKNV